MHIQFLGAAQTVTGSCHLITLDSGYRILLDCGLYQGRDFDKKKFNETWLVDPQEIDLVLLSHAHIDHAGRLPRLVKDGFKKRIYATPATRDLCAIMLLDSAYIQEREAEYKNKRKSRRESGDLIEPLYRAEDVAKAMQHFHAVPYEEWTEVDPAIKFKFSDAGHILGSASIILKIQESGRWTNLAFSGDIGRPGRPILRDPSPLQEADYVICESTYGGKEHLAAPDEREELLRIVKETCIEQKGKLIIPAFSLGRTQEIVYMLDDLELKGLLPKIPVYVDSPLAVNATEVFRMHPECYDAEILAHMVKDPNPFGWNQLHYLRKAEDSKALNDNPEPMIIISASGMVTAGRILHHVKNNVEDPKNTILIVGYCAEHTIGAQLARGFEMVKIYGEEKKVNCRVERMHSFSAHGDQSEMLDFLKPLKKEKVKKIFLVHGDKERQERFKSALLEDGFLSVEIPEIGEKFELQ